MSDQGVAVGQLRAFVERVERVEEEIKTLNDDKSEIYKEIRGFGFDVKAVRKVVAKRKLDPSVATEQDAVFDLYWDALTGASHVHVHEEGNSYASQKGIDPKLAHTIVTGMQTETGRKALVAAVDIMIEREEHIDPETGEITESLADRPSDAVSERAATLVDASASAEAAIEGQPSLTAATSAKSAGEAVSTDLPTNSPETATRRLDGFCSVQDGLKMSTNGPNAGVAEQQNDTGSADDMSVTAGETATDQFTPPAFLAQKSMRDYRPHCQRPDACGASGLRHCYSCSKLVQAESEVA